MRSIHLQHFRCYSDLRLELKPGINLFVGDNASGKTSLLRAYQYMLSSFFAGFSDEYTKWLSFGDDDFQQEFQRGKQLDEQPISISFDPSDLIERLSPEYLEEQGALGEQVLEKRSAKNRRALTGGFKAYRSYAQWLQSHYYDREAARQRYPLPLFAYYSVEDIHSNRKLSLQPFSKTTSKFSLGYLECLEGDGFLRYWVHRLLVLAERDPEHSELGFVRRQMLEILGAEGCGLFYDMLIRPIKREVVFVTPDGREIPTAFLSEGYKRIISMSLDLVMRSYLLDYPIYGDETCRHITGTVIIDEIDMHLHPRLQAEILPVLHRCFPALQFIVSTHAPMVMSGVQSDGTNIVYRLRCSSEAEYSLEEATTYGLDISTLVERLWELAPRSHEVSSQLAELFRAIDAGDYQKARELLQRLRQAFPGGELKELTRADTLLRLMQRPPRL